MKDVQQNSLFQQSSFKIQFTLLLTPHLIPQTPFPYPFPRLPPFSRKLLPPLKIQQNNPIIIIMPNRKSLSPKTIPSLPQLPPADQSELTRLCTFPREQSQKKENPLSPPSKGTPSPPLSTSCLRWLFRGVICLLLTLLLAEYFLGLQLRFRQARRFIQNVKVLRREQWGRGGRGSSGSGKGISRDAKGEDLLKLEQVGGKGSEQKDKAIGNKEKRENGVDGKLILPRANGNLPYTPPIPAPPQQLQTQTLPGASPTPIPSFAYFNQGTQAADPLLLKQPQEEAVPYQPPMNPSVHHNEEDSHLFPVSLPNQDQNQIPLVYGQSQVPPPPSPPQLLPPPEAIPNIDVTPTILPFAGPFPPPDNNPFSSFAGIHPNQLTKANSLRKLIDATPNQAEPIAKSEREYYQSRYRISTYPELPFCLVVPTFNNAVGDRYIRNIRSIIMQEYTNFHVVIIDDKSQDNTGGLIRGLLESQNTLPPERYKLIINQERMRAMGNIRAAAMTHCKPQEIFMIIDGDDELVGRQVLKLFNAVFQEKKLYFVYSNFLTTTGSIGFSRPFPGVTMKKNGYRSYPFVTSHLRAFYTKLLVNINEEDLRDAAGEYLKAGNDVAICIPILQQAHERVGYLPELTYFYNSATGMNNHQLRLSEQRGNDRMVRGRKQYKRVEGLQ